MAGVDSQFFTAHIGTAWQKAGMRTVLERCKVQLLKVLFRIRSFGPRCPEKAGVTKVRDRGWGRWMSGDSIGVEEEG